MDQAELKSRTKQFALRVIRLVQFLPYEAEAQVIGKQLLRSATSVAANYRAVCRSRSDSEFIARTGVVLEEADESMFWLELLLDSGIVAANRIDDLTKEASELTAIFAASRITVQRKARAK